MHLNNVENAWQSPPEPESFWRRALGWIEAPGQHRLALNLSLLSFFIFLVILPILGTAILPYGTLLRRLWLDACFCLGCFSIGLGCLVIVIRRECYVRLFLRRKRLSGGWAVLNGMVGLVLSWAAAVAFLLELWKDLKVG
jgi:hypothetical protein